MGLRLYSEFHSSTDKLFKIEIHDTSYSGTAEEFTVAGDGFTLNYSGETDDIVSPIISSNCTISAYNNSDAFDTFINLLKNYQEERFYVRIYGEGSAAQDGLVFDFYETELPGDGGLTLYWSGVIMQDLITVEDTHKPYVFQITAVDGIGHLANTEYTFSAFETVEGFIERAVGAIGTATLYAADDLYYATTLNTWETNHTYDINTDVATLIRYYAPNLQTREQDGTKVYPKYLEVMQELCIAFGARFYQREGVYYFEQYIERTETSRTVSAYYKNGTKAFTSTVSDDVTLDGTTGGGARLAGNQFNFLPAIKRVEVTHNKELRQNLLGRFVDFYTTTPALSLGVLSDDNNAYLKLEGNLVYRLVHPTTGSNTGYFRPRYRIQLKIEDQANPGTYYYLKRDWSPSGGLLYGATSWTTTASYYYLDAGIVQNSSTGLTVANKFTVVTPSLPVEGEAEVDIEQNGLYNQSNASVSVPSGYFASWSVEKVLISYLSTQSNSVSTRYLSTNGSGDIKSNLVLDLGEVRTADAFGGPGSFFVYDGSSWVPSADWRRGNSGAYNDLLDLLTSEVLSLHSKPIERYSGTIVGPYPFGIRYSFDSFYWLPMQGSYNANMDEWSAEWFKVQKDDSNVEIGTPVDDGNAADFVGRVSSQQGTDEVLNVLDLNTTDASVSNDATVGNDLTVSGGSILQSTSVTDFSHSGNQIESITDVEHEPGSSYNVGASDFMIFNTWRGSNGTATINLPAAGDNEGRLIRFKSDGTISANTAINLVPDGSDTIDGNGEVAFNRDYDGIMLLAHNGDWYIIQRKSK